MPLNIDLQQILLHLFNFVVLFAILYFLLYKPVKQFMDKRTEYYKEIDEQAKANLEDSQKTKEEYLRRLEAVDDEISEKKSKALKELDGINAIKTRQAEEQAEKIIADAHKRAENERAKMLSDVRKEMSEMVTAAAEKIILNSSTSESYEQFLAAVERGGEHE